MRKSGRGGRSDPEKVCLYLLIQYSMKELHLVEAIPATESHDDGLALLLTETESLCVAWLVGLSSSLICQDSLRKKNMSRAKYI